MMNQIGFMIKMMRLSLKTKYHIAHSKQCGIFMRGLGLFVC